MNTTINANRVAALKFNKISRSVKDFNSVQHAKVITNAELAYSVIH